MNIDAVGHKGMTQKMQMKSCARSSVSAEWTGNSSPLFRDVLPWTWSMPLSVFTAWHTLHLPFWHTAYLAAHGKRLLWESNTGSSVCLLSGESLFFSSFPTASSLQHKILFGEGFCDCVSEVMKWGWKTAQHLPMLVFFVVIACSHKCSSACGQTAEESSNSSPSFSLLQKHSCSVISSESFHLHYGYWVGRPLQRSAAARRCLSWNHNRTLSWGCWTKLGKFLSGSFHSVVHFILLPGPPLLVCMHVCSWLCLDMTAVFFVFFFSHVLWLLLGMWF